MGLKRQGRIIYRKTSVISCFHQLLLPSLVFMKLRSSSAARAQNKDRWASLRGTAHEFVYTWSNFLATQTPSSLPQVDALTTFSVTLILFLHIKNHNSNQINGASKIQMYVSDIRERTLQSCVIWKCGLAWRQSTLCSLYLSSKLSKVESV